jgi:hypothetical protein
VPRPSRCQPMISCQPSFSALPTRHSRPLTGSCLRLLDRCRLNLEPSDVVACAAGRSRSAWSVTWVASMAAVYGRPDPARSLGRATPARLPVIEAVSGRFACRGPVLVRARDIRFFAPVPRQDRGLCRCIHRSRVDNYPAPVRTQTRPHIVHETSSGLVTGGSSARELARGHPRHRTAALARFAQFVHPRPLAESGSYQGQGADSARPWTPKPRRDKPLVVTDGCR